MGAFLLLLQGFDLAQKVFPRPIQTCELAHAGVTGCGRSPTAERAGGWELEGACPPESATPPEAVGSPPLSESSERAWEAGTSAAAAVADSKACSSADMVWQADLAKAEGRRMLEHWCCEYGQTMG